MAAPKLNAKMADALEQQWARRVEPIVCLTLPFPISTNRLWRPANGRLVKTKRYLTWRRDAGNEINRQRPGRIAGPFNAQITLERKPGRNRIDADNGVKCLFDILQHCRVIDNDKFAVEIRVMWSGGIRGSQVVLTSVSDSASLVRRVAA